ncbi:MAG TPA: hypothetical protein VM580_02780, partial [Labilithrix sp.]|nr:hypothetical protein [Labilithrix sp.]
MRAHRTIVAAGVLGACLLVPIAAEAQPSGQDIATAQALFDDGKRLMQAGKYDEGCAALVESQRLDPAGGTMLMIALCHESQGKTATAWAEFGMALSDARKDRRADRESAALEHIRKLEPKLTRARIIVTEKVDGLTLHRDGSLVGEAQWRTALPIDPGEHTFEARAPGKKPWSTTVMMSGEAAVIDVTVPPLEDEPLAQVIPPANETPAQPSPERRAAPPPEKHASRTPWIALAGGVGLVGVGVGIATWASASAQWKDVEAACPNGQCTSASDLEKGKNAGTMADIATASFIVGGVGLATAAVLFFTAPKDGARSSS